MLKIGRYRRSSQARIVYFGGKRGYVAKLMPCSRIREETTRYHKVASYIPVPRLVLSGCVAGHGAIVYVRASGLPEGMELFADAFFREDQVVIRLTMDALLETYGSLIEQTLQWQNKSEANEAYFANRIGPSDRLRRWYFKNFPYIDYRITSAEGAFDTKLRTVLDFLIGWSEVQSPTYSIMSQGDPTEYNIGVPLCFFDFGAAGRNPLLGDVANLLWSIHGQGGYFVPVYNSVAVEFRASWRASVDRNRPQLTYVVSDAARTIRIEGRISAERTRRFALQMFGQSVLWNKIKELFAVQGRSAEAEILPYLLSRILLVFDPRQMKTEDMIALLGFAAELFHKGGEWYFREFCGKIEGQHG